MADVAGTTPLLSNSVDKRGRDVERVDLPRRRRPEPRRHRAAKGHRGGNPTPDRHLAVQGVPEPAETFKPQGTAQRPRRLGTAKLDVTVHCAVASPPGPGRRVRTISIEAIAAGRETLRRIRTDGPGRLVTRKDRETLHTVLQSGGHVQSIRHRNGNVNVHVHIRLRITPGTEARGSVVPQRRIDGVEDELINPALADPRADVPREPVRPHGPEPGHDRMITEDTAELRGETAGEPGVQRETVRVCFHGGKRRRIGPIIRHGNRRAPGSARNAGRGPPPIPHQKRRNAVDQRTPEHPATGMGMTIVEPPGDPATGIVRMQVGLPPRRQSRPEVPEQLDVPTHLGLPPHLRRVARRRTTGRDKTQRIGTFEPPCSSEPANPSRD